LKSDRWPGADRSPHQIFSTAFRRFADSAKSERLEREVPWLRAAQLAPEALMAGLPTYAT